MKADMFILTLCAVCAFVYIVLATTVSSDVTTLVLLSLITGFCAGVWVLPSGTGEKDGRSQ
jgi:hypothetical protein